MKLFNQLPEFERELKQLSKKYRSLTYDIADFEDIIKSSPTGFGNNFVIIHSTPTLKIVKVRLACESLKNRNIRIIYAYHGDKFEFMYIEIYFKGEKVNEDKARIKEYLSKII
ncbi:MAG: hypothetical protein WAV23_03885 [Minisyncoccia bacterium]